MWRGSLSASMCGDGQGQWPFPKHEIRACSIPCHLHQFMRFPRDTCPRYWSEKKKLNKSAEIKHTGPCLNILNLFSEINGWHSSFHLVLTSFWHRPPLLRQLVMLMSWRIRVRNVPNKKSHVQISCKDRFSLVSNNAEIFWLTCGRCVSLCLSVWRWKGSGLVTASKTWESSIQHSVTLLSVCAFSSWHLSKVLTRKSAQTLTLWRISQYLGQVSGRGKKAKDKKRKEKTKDRNPFFSKPIGVVQDGHENRR